jgi:orotate phosphoribosyltransferase
MRTDRDQLVRLLAQYAYQEGDFTLTSGAKSTFYLDAKKVTYRADGAALVGAAVHEIAARHGANAVGGLTMGADAIVASAVTVSAATSNTLMGFIARKEPKKHGTGKWIEGVAPRGMRVVIVDDVITTGDSLLRAVELARNDGAEVVATVGVVDREQGGAASIRDKTGVPFFALSTIAEIKAAATLASHA